MGSDTVANISDMRSLQGRITQENSFCFASGGNADIWKARWQDKVGRERTVAVKVLRTDWSDPNCVAKLAQRLNREARVWSGLTHPNILPFYGISYDMGGPNVPSLVSPYCENKSINKYLSQHEERDKLELITQVGAALDYLHNLRPPVVHGDIKGPNILIDDEGNARLSDFGISRILQESGFTTKNIAGTPRWMPPELLFPENKTNDEVTVATHSDVWAFAMTILEVMTGHLPFAETRHDSCVIRDISKGGRPQRPPKLGNPVWDVLWALLERCWVEDPAKRPTIRQVALALDLMHGCNENKFDVFTLTDILKDESKSWPVRSGRTGLPQAPVTRPDLPYKCKWSCEGHIESYETLQECILHEVEVFQRDNDA